MSDAEYILPKKVRTACAATLGTCIAWAKPFSAFAGKYSDISGEIDEETYKMKSIDEGFAETVVNIIFDVTTKFLLPVAIVIVIAKAVYIAIFGIMAATDPIHLIQKQSGNDFESVSPEDAKRAFADEIRKTAKALIVVFGLWTFINAIARIVMYIFVIIGS